MEAVETKLVQAEKAAKSQAKKLADIQIKKITPAPNGASAWQPMMDLFKENGFLIAGRKMSEKQFEKFSRAHELFQMERESDGTIIIMPVHTPSGKRELSLGAFVYMWHLQHQKGATYSSSTGFKLPDGSIRSPDACWISDERLAKVVSEDEENEYMKVVPDFVAELRSGSDRIPRVKDKMKKVWMKNGVRLAWLIDPYEEKVYIYREDKAMEVVEGFSGKKLSGENVLPGLEFPLDEIKIKKW